jgi:hypothetical protein
LSHITKRVTKLALLFPDENFPVLSLCFKVFLQVKQVVLLHEHKLGYEAQELGCWKVGS